VLATLRWLAGALVPAVLFAVWIYRTDKRREPIPLVIATFVLGVVAGFFAFFVDARAAHFTGLDLRTSVAGNVGALVFVFGIVAPLGEAAKVAAVWPAFRSRHFDEPYDGIVYAGAAALGFAAVEGAIVLRVHPQGSIWFTRVLFALAAHLFFACAWGYALGRAKQSKRPGALFPLSWTGAMLAHGLYVHFVYGRGPGALLGVAPLLLAMGALAWFAGRDLVTRGDRPSRTPGPYNENRLSRASATYLPAPPSFDAVRQALRRSDEPIKVRWILFGAFVTLGAMITGVAGGVLLGHLAHIDFSVVDEHDVTTIGPVALLGAGLLAAFPLSGYLVARGSGAHTLLEPALAAALALVVTWIALGLAAPIALVFALACSPVAWGLSCAGAWIGRSSA
jgi:RsiW-degrading membrane proteinase PrsW (M82 family)